MREILQIKQEGLSFEMYLGKIKNEILKRNNLIKRCDRDSFAKPFFNRLDDLYVKDALKSLNPQTLKEASEMVKNLKVPKIFPECVVKESYVDDFKWKRNHFVIKGLI